MATNQMSGFIQHLRRVLRDGAGLTDGQLLGDYLSRRDEAAIAALVRRHGPMVWGVCRRVLRNHHDAEDAFQTTFLVLVRKAASIASRELLANWLYGVAHQTALKARATAAKRKERERQAAEMPEPAATQQDPWCDLQPLLDEELSRLPDKYRSVIVLCDLEGKTRKEAARQLGCPEGTVAGRLARARIMLAKRLTRRGVALSGGALAAVLSQQAASAGVPTSVAVSTIKAATLLAAGKAAATGVISVKVVALTEGVMKAMLLTKLKTLMGCLLVAALVGFGAAVGAAVIWLELEIKAKAPANNCVKAPEKQEEQDKDVKMNPLKHRVYIEKVSAETQTITASCMLRVYIEKVNAETQTITASCMLLGEIDNVTKPLRLENLRVSEKAMLREGGKEIQFKLTDLKLDAGYFLHLKTYEDGLGFEVVGIEKIGIGK
jgi:RNA polymerase sigma factor (sigma-70 family)